METNSSNTSLCPQAIAPQMQTRVTASVRQPVSCEPCRRRKIKCSRTRPPCDTCRRRGCAEDCVYKGSRSLMTPNAAVGPNTELLTRISNLENLLWKHTGAQISNPVGNGQTTSPMMSPPVEANQPFQPSSVSSSFESESPSQISYSSEPVSARGKGVLRTSPNGNVRYDAQSSQWTSVLANTALSNLAPSLDDQEDSGYAFGFPFTSSAVSSVDDLLALLPPIQQCDYLKNTYFSVFSPVCHFIYSHQEPV